MDNEQKSFVVGDELQLDRLVIDYNSILGRGAFGKVYKAKYANTSDVAVKVLDLSKLGERGMRDVKHEVRFSKQLNYSCLLNYYGYCHNESNDIFIVMELASGCLEKLKSDMSIDDKLSAAYDVAKCLSAIHGNDPPVIHCDIATRNVLRRKDGSYSLSDFGLAKEAPNGIILLFILNLYFCIHFTIMNDC